MKRVAAIMVNWNGGSVAVESAISITNQSVQPELIVVDNASTDGFAHKIKESCPSARIVWNNENIGFAAANNQALRECNDFEYILLINNDALLPQQDGMEKIIAYLDNHPHVHGACGRYEYPDGEFQRFYNQLPTLFDLIVYYGIARHFRPLLRSPKLSRYFALDRDFTKPMSLEQPGFACVLMRGECVRQVGLMDESFPILFNDVDYCWRWREKGFSWLYFPKWRIIHHKGKSQFKTGTRVNADAAISVVRFARKHFSSVAATALRISVTAEAAWRKYRHGDMPVSIIDVWRGKHYFHNA